MISDVMFIFPIIAVGALTFLLGKFVVDVIRGKYRG